MAVRVMVRLANAFMRREKKKMSPFHELSLTVGRSLHSLEPFVRRSPSVRAKAQ